ncbi:YeeE/YedE family protein [Paraburkholderia lacunae]|uniref:YeeE/YedE n=1 Tax=Paraburkholderia lacunae TaxID=2211104 RepID=A0A370N996_9BURK|nr:YeeE/YedE family protein [Paraburkholderia lacunae]RDK02190.1 YeeE/YedE [Paraburkholderia lacunae]
MSLDVAHFAPLPALAGGLLIGLAAALLVLGNGRIAGISGILGGLLESASGDRAWRAAFVLGLFAAPWVFKLFAPLPAVTIASSPPVLVVAGLLVGIGTRYGSGCTSGHGVCGLSRGSVRSLAATATFMAVGFGTVFVARHLLGF